MMTRFCAYVAKCFQFGDLLQTVTDSRKKKPISSAAIFASAWAMFATGRISLNSVEKDLVKIPSRLRGVVGPRTPRVDSVGRI